VHSAAVGGSLEPVCRAGVCGAGVGLR
jgi:hypothetical protein